MFIYSALFLLFATTINCRSHSEDRQTRQLWDRLLNKFNADNRHFDKEAILLFPDVGFRSLDNNDTWKVTVHGWKYQTSKRKDWLALSTSSWIERLAKNLLNQNDVLYLNGTINRERLQPFFVTDAPDKQAIIKIGDNDQLIRTDRSGQFYEHIEVSNDVIEQRRKGNLMAYELVDDDDDQKNTTGIIHLIEPSQGISVISDIDDTIKISEVLDKVRLLVNTFIYPFKAVPGKSKQINFQSPLNSLYSTGMSYLYQQWKAKYPNCAFHYLSGMPDQLYTLTQEFINTNKFPDGSFHMRHFGWRIGSLFDFLHSQSTFDHKMRYLRFFLSNTERDYVLIGDSGEKDPEIYGTITREYPERIRAIFIRAIKGEAFNDQRFQDAFQDIPEEKWLIFNDPKQVPIDLSRPPRVTTG
jgi:phosphatidate phosphatase APP1